MIDVDHYLDDLTVEGNGAGHHYHRLVLPLHSIELTSALVTLAVAWPRLALVGCPTGASSICC